MPRSRYTELRLTPQALVATLHCRRVDFYTIQQIQRLIYSPYACMFQKPVVLDLSRVQFIPRLTMQILFKTLQEMKDQGQRFLITGLEQHQHLAADIIQFRLRFEMFEDVQAALDSLTWTSWRPHPPARPARDENPDKHSETLPSVQEAS